ncbi:MAG TPA: extracellular solute-binding protein [Patescibacteria group bacterium]|nr:extracellular solute-binding protein [Patescibacteria group bacterium]
MKLKFNKDDLKEEVSASDQTTYRVDPMKTPLGKQAVNNSVITPTTPLEEAPPSHEEFVYTPKPQFDVAKKLKFVLPVFFIIILLVPLYFVVTKLNLFSKKPIGTKGEIVWWGIGLDENVVAPVIEKYQEENPKAKIKYIKQSEIDYGQRLQNAIDQGVGPDIFSYHNTWTPMFKNDLDVVPETVYTKEEFATTFYPVVSRFASTSEGLVGIPLEYDALTLYINEDILSQAGKTAPRTWDQFKEVAIALTTKGEKGFVLQSGAAMGLTENVDYWPEIVGLLMLQNKANILKPENDTGPEAITFYTDFFAKDKVWDESLPNSVQAFIEGKVAMMIAPVRVYQDIKSKNPSLRFRTSNLPQVRRDDPNEPEVAYATYWLQGVWKKSASRDLSWDFLKYLSQKDTLLSLNQRMAELGVASKAYPRIDMRDLIINDRYLGSIAALAPTANSGYLAFNTQDGPDGVNTLLGNVYQGGIASLTTAPRRSNIDAVVKKMNVELAKVVFKYGLR